MISLFAALALSACGSGVEPSALQESPAPAVAAAAEGNVAQSSGGICQMTAEWDAAEQSFRATYLTPRLCGSEAPRWVPIDTDVEFLDMALRNLPDGKRVACAPQGCIGWYMEPVNFRAWVPSDPSRVYTVQARSGANGGRADVTFTMGAK